LPRRGGLAGADQPVDEVSGSRYLDQHDARQMAHLVRIDVGAQGDACALAVPVMEDLGHGRAADVQKLQGGDSSVHGRP
jgi:hypothetical protein